MDSLHRKYDNEASGSSKKSDCSGAGSSDGVGVAAPCPKHTVCESPPGVYFMCFTI